MKYYYIFSKEKCDRWVELDVLLGWRLYVILFCVIFTSFQIFIVSYLWLLSNIFGFHIVGHLL